MARNQRERLVAAIAEECAERGYAETSVARVAKQAGVSSVTFYRQFADKGDCMLAAHRELSGRLLEELDRAGRGVCRSKAADDAAGISLAGARTTIHTALALFAADPPSARLLTVEILAAGPEGVEHHDAMVAAFVERLRGDDPAAPASDWVRVAGMLALVGKLVATGEAARLPGLEDELVAALSPQS
ncbi:MAG: TetR/AcrR family transcriptional regulator [Solirubrobacterales bacterium]